jgi:phenylalanyl-tRNA synthetase beta subunit
MSTIKKIQPRANVDIDLDLLTQKIRATKESQIEESIVGVELAKKEPKPAKEKTVKVQAVMPTKVLKKAGRKKTNTEAMHRFAIDIPESLFEQIRNDATTNFSTVRGEIIKVLLKHYKA